jgi:hypothetical protein
MRRETITLGELVGVGVTLVVVGLVFTFGTQIISETRSHYYPTCINGSTATTGYTGGDSFSWNIANQTCYNMTVNALGGYNQSGAWNKTEAYLSANSSLTGMTEIPTRLPTIALVIAVGVIITILLRSFMQNK